MPFKFKFSDKLKADIFHDSGDRAEFIPYHSHYNPHTLATKNGELMQTIKIDGNIAGRNCENLDGTHASICATIRQVISRSEPGEQFSFWLHTIRRRESLGYASSAKNEGKKNNEDFADYLNEQWAKKHSWDSVYRNDIYLTVLREGQNIPFFDSKNAKTVLFPKTNYAYCNSYLEEAYKDLENYCNFLLDALRSQCSAKKLTIVERQLAGSGKVARPSIFYSEPLEFLGMLLNLQPEAFPLPDLDLSVALQTTHLFFGFNAVEARHRENESKRFASMLTVKQYIDSFVDAPDCVLQAPIEFIISQSFVFSSAKKALKHYEIQKGLFNMSGDLKANKNFGIEQMMNFNKATPVDFGEQQISIAVFTDNLKNLDIETGKFINAFNKMGMVIIREDILTEECFLAQLPGNFEFIRRRSPIATEQIGAFCRLNRYHTGNVSGNHWGDRLAVIPADSGSPFFFNLHVGDNGHTAIFDFNSFDDRMGKVLEYFLLTKARKFDAKMFLFDRDQSARLWFNKMKGTYYSLTQLEKYDREKIVDKSPRLYLNPFAMEESNYNISFLAAWCGLLISSDEPVEEDSRAVLREAVTQLYNFPKQERNLENFVVLLARINPDLAKSLEKWKGKGEYAGLFDCAEDKFDAGAMLTAFNMTPALAKQGSVLPIFAYLMHRIIDSIDGKPTIIVLNEAWDLLENYFFAPRLESLLEMLREKNVAVVFTSSNPAACGGTATLDAVMKQAATKIYVPDEMPPDYKEQGVGLNNRDAILLLDMVRPKGDFLLKQDGESIALKASLADFEDITAIFNNDVKGVVSARGKFAGAPKDY